MKVIVSHDVDHFGFLEHWRDPIIPKFLARMMIELKKGTIGPKQVLGRLADILRNRREHIEDVLAFDNANGIRPTFFIGMANGVGLAYSHQAASRWVRQLKGKNCDVGIHGIAFSDRVAMQLERSRFEQALGHGEFGIRMHYLRMDATTLGHIEQLGYLFDTTGPEDRSPWKTEGGMWVFPLHLMDGWYMLGDCRYQSRTALEAFEESKKRIDELAAKGIDYLTLNFHDSYFSTSFAAWKEWYARCIDYLGNTMQVDFIDYRSAIASLEQQNSTTK